MPRERWALVWWGEAALIFLRRDLLERQGLPEYRWHRPRDQATLTVELRRWEAQR